MSLEISPKLQHKIEQYASFHRNRWNQWIHFLGVPAITLSILSFASALEFGQAWSLTSGFVRLDGGVALWALVTTWLTLLDRKVGFLFSIAALALYILARAIPMPVAVALFVGGWVVQLIGHHQFEKNKPAFLQNLEQLLVGPVWMFLKMSGLWDLARKE
jgi:uncharacterized membrane protein YGL010W